MFFFCRLLVGLGSVNTMTDRVEIAYDVLSKWYVFCASTMTINVQISIWILQSKKLCFEYLFHILVYFHAKFQLLRKNTRCEKHEDKIEPNLALYSFIDNHLMSSSGMRPDRPSKPHLVPGVRVEKTDKNPVTLSNAEVRALKKHVNLRGFISQDKSAHDILTNYYQMAKEV